MEERVTYVTDCDCPRQAVQFLELMTADDGFPDGVLPSVFLPRLDRLCHAVDDELRVRADFQERGAYE